MTLLTDQLVPLRDALADVLLDEWERLAAYLFRQRHKAIALWDDDDLDELLEEYDDGPLAQQLQQPVITTPLWQAYVSGGGQAEISLGIAWGAKNAYALDYARQRAAEMVGMRVGRNGRLTPNPDARWAITDTTRQGLKRLILDTMEGTESYRDLKTKIEQLPAFSGLFGEYRAEMIARSELALATNAGTFGTYEHSGITYVRVHDGAGCGWLHHSDPDLADRSIRTLAEAREHPISHPNCVRAFSSWQPESVAKAETAGITAETGLVGYNLEGQRQPKRECDCGYEVEPGAKQCPKCGEPLDWMD